MKIKYPLSRLHPRSFEVPTLILASIITLIYGLQLPVITLKELVFWVHTFSILSGIQNLWQEHYYFLAMIIVAFSILFPFFKLTTLLVIWFGRLSEAQRQLALKGLGLFGKWSMLDVFVVAVTIVVTKLSKLASAQAEIGIYIFGCSVMLSMLATMRIEYLSKKNSG